MLIKVGKQEPPSQSPKDKNIPINRSVQLLNLSAFLILLDNAECNIAPELAKPRVVSQVVPEGTESRSKTEDRKKLGKKGSNVFVKYTKYSCRNVKA